MNVMDGIGNDWNKKPKVAFSLTMGVEGLKELFKR